MTRFRFRLQRVLEWRVKQLELEEACFKQRSAEMAELDRVQAGLRTAEHEAETELRKGTAISGQDLAALAGYRQFVQNRLRQLAAEREAAVKRVAEQERVMMEARRRCRLLEHLRERRLAEWEAARDKELEAVASESYLAGWVRASEG